MVSKLDQHVKIGRIKVRSNVRWRLDIEMEMETPATCLLEVDR